MFTWTNCLVFTPWKIMNNSIKPELDKKSDHLQTLLFFVLLNFTMDEKACLFNRKTSLTDIYISFDPVTEECSAKNDVRGKIDDFNQPMSEFHEKYNFG